MKSINKSNNFKNVELYKIENFVWDTTGYKPEAYVQMAYDDNGFNIKLTGTEKEVIAVIKEDNKPVYQDSCLEVFIQPDIGNDQRYFNFEINAIGTSITQIGLDGLEREFLTEKEVESLNIKTDVNLENIKEFNDFKKWSIEFTIPFALVKKYFNRFDIISIDEIKCNFYKCGDRTEHKHYGALFPISYHKPSFHRPEFFKSIKINK